MLRLCSDRRAHGLENAFAATDHHPSALERSTPTQTGDAKKLASVKGKPPFGNVKDIGTGTLERAEKSAVISTRELLDIAEVHYVAQAAGLL